MKRFLHGLGALGLAARVVFGCTSNEGVVTPGGDEPGRKGAPGSSAGGSTGGAATVSGAGDDAGSAGVGTRGRGAGEGASSGAGGGTMAPPSCEGGGDGVTRCGPMGESCCTSAEVSGGTYLRTYASSGGISAGSADPAVVSGFRLDRYEVTVGRFRAFVNAWNGGAGWLPADGSGKHAHLNGGRGLINSGVETAYEPGWASSDDGNVSPTNANLACESQLATWTASAGSLEDLPVNCVNWYEAFAFCIWDGGFLPSEAEWEYAAAGGSEQRDYPWGSTDPGTASQYAIYDCDYPAGAGHCTGGAAPVGTATLGAGLWGQVDLAGNVNEWSADSFAAYVGGCSDCAQLDPAPFRVIRGGYFDNDASYLSPPARSDDPATVRSICIGIRCARTP
jgi:sulfatase modifying factor 1